MTDNSKWPSLLVEKGWVEKLDKSAIPNIKNLVNVQRHPAWDPNRDYSLPWQSGIVGIAYNDTLTDSVLTIDDLLGNPKLKGKITVLNEMADCMCSVMLSNGDDPTHVTDATFNRALDRLQKAKDSGQIRQFTGNDYAPPLARGDLAAAMSWSGDIPQLGPTTDPPALEHRQRRRQHLDGQHAHPQRRRRLYRVRVHELRLRPEGPGPDGGRKPQEEHHGIYYITPVIGAKEAALKTNPAVANNPLIFPTQQMLDNVYLFDPKALTNQKYEEAWNNLAF